VDDTDDGADISALFLLEHSVQDGHPVGSGAANVISRKLQFAAIDEAGVVTDAGIAPHLNLRPATPGEIDSVADLLAAGWLRDGLEKTVLRFAEAKLAQSHAAEVRARRLPEIDKVEREVKARLKKEINHWDSRAVALKQQEKAGKKTRLNWRNAQRRAEALAERLQRRLKMIERERLIAALPPQVRGGMVVVPRGLLHGRMQAGIADAGSGFSEDPIARRAVELKAMAAVMGSERNLGNRPEDVSAQKVGYDIASYDPRTGHLRFIEVKGRVEGADTVTITRQEVITSLHAPDAFILAIVQVGDGHVHAPCYVRGALDTREPPFEQSAIQFNLKPLLARAEAPR